MTRAEARKTLVAAFAALTPKERARLYRRRKLVTCYGKRRVGGHERCELYADGMGGVCPAQAAVPGLVPRRPIGPNDSSSAALGVYTRLWRACDANDGSNTYICALAAADRRTAQAAIREACR